MIPRLHLILDLPVVDAAGRDPLRIACAAVEGGAGAVHLRGRDLPAGELLDWSRKLRTVLAGRALLLVNDRLDVALAAQADGVQLPAAGLPPRAARDLIQVAGQHDAASRGGSAPGQDDARWQNDTTQRMPFLIGCSVHDVAQARAATEAGADYLLLGTVFASQSHPGRAPGGEDLVRAVRAATRLPLIAIGGITPATAGRAIRAGADGVVVIRAIADAPDPAEAASALLREVEYNMAHTMEQVPGQGAVEEAGMPSVCK